MTQLPYLAKFGGVGTDSRAALLCGAVSEKSAHLSKLLESVKWRVKGYKGDDAEGQPLAHPVSRLKPPTVPSRLDAGSVVRPCCPCKASPAA